MGLHQAVAAVRRKHKRGAAGAPFSIAILQLPVVTKFTRPAPGNYGNLMKHFFLVMVLLALGVLACGCTTLHDFYGSVYDALQFRNRQESLPQEQSAIQQPMSYNQYEFELKKLQANKGMK